MSKKPIDPELGAHSLRQLLMALAASNSNHPAHADDQFWRGVCGYFLENPKRQLPLTIVVRHLMRRFVEAVPYKPPSGKKIAGWVDDFYEEGKGQRTLTEARTTIADLAGKSYEAVEKDHQRYGRHKGRLPDIIK